MLLGSKLKHTTKSLAANDIQIVPTSNPALLVNQNSSVYSFETPLPAGSPETIKCTQIHVEYQLTVKMMYKKSTDSQTILTEQLVHPVILARLPENGIVAGENNSTFLAPFIPFDDCCQYRITLDKKAIALGSQLPVKIEMIPTVPGLRLKQVFLQLLERRTVTNTELQGQANQLCHFLYPAKGSVMSLPQRPLTQPWQGHCLYQIPEESKIAHTTQSYAEFHVDHVLLASLVISLPDATGRIVTKTISFQTQIDVLDAHVSVLADHYSRLPPYDDPVSIQEVETLKRHGLNIGLLPSYDEAIAI